MADSVELIECPRDAWQGLAGQIPADLKVSYLQALISVGFKHMDAASFVSPKTVPQMADSEEVLKELDPPDDVEIDKPLPDGIISPEDRQSSPRFSYLFKEKLTVRQMYEKYGGARGQRFAAKMTALTQARQGLAALRMTPPALKRRGIAVNEDGITRSAAELLAYPGIDVARLARVWPELAPLAPDIAEQLEIDAKYAVYLARQAADVESYRRDESLVLGDAIDYATLPGLSNEARHKLQLHRPRTIGHASRIDGVTPAALTLLAAHLHRQGRKRDRGVA